MKNALLSLALSLILFSCKPTHEKVIDKFQTEQQLFDDFAKSTSQDEMLKGNPEKAIKPDQLSEQTQENLAKLGLERVLYVIWSRAECEQAGEYSIEVVFNGDCHLAYYSCGRPHFIPRGYRKRDLIESWGMNKHWALWINNDFIG